MAFLKCSLYSRSAFAILKCSRRALRSSSLIYNAHDDDGSDHRRLEFLKFKDLSFRSYKQGNIRKSQKLAVKAADLQLRKEGDESNKYVH